MAFIRTTDRTILCMTMLPPLLLLDLEKEEGDEVEGEV